MKCAVHWCNAYSTQNSRWCAVHQDEHEQQDFRMSEGPYPLDMAFEALQKGLLSAITGAGSGLYDEAKRFKQDVQSQGLAGAGRNIDARLQGAVAGSQSGGYLDPSTPNPVHGFKNAAGEAWGPQIEIPKLGGDPSQELNWVDQSIDPASAKAASLQNLKPGALRAGKAGVGAAVGAGLAGPVGAVVGAGLGGGYGGEAVDALRGGARDMARGAHTGVKAAIGEPEGKGLLAGVTAAGRKIGNVFGVPNWGSRDKMGGQGDKYKISPDAPRFVRNAQEKIFQQKLHDQGRFKGGAAATPEEQKQQLGEFL